MPEEDFAQGKSHFQQQWESAERKADDLEKRIDALERDNDRLRAAQSGTPPMGQRPPPVARTPGGDPSRAEPGSQRHSLTRAERAEQEAQLQARAEFARSPVSQELAQLKADLFALKQWQSQLQGRGGIVVTGTIIELRRNVNDTGGGSASGDATPCYFLRTGVLVYANILTSGPVITV